MHLTTLVGILERDQSSTSNVASVRGNLARLYADRGRHADAVEQLVVVRNALKRQGKGTGASAVQTAAALANSLFELGKVDEAKREAKAALARGVAPELVAGLKRIIATPSVAAAR